MRTVWTADRVAECRMLRDGGATLKMLGQHYGVTPMRIRQVLEREARQERTWQSQMRDMAATHDLRGLLAPPGMAAQIIV